MSMKKEKDNDCISTRIEGETKRNGFISIEDVRDLQKARPAILCIVAADRAALLLLNDLVEDMI